MTRADLTYALTAVLPHEGRKGGVGLSVRTGALRAYAMDGYTAGLTQVSWPQASPLDACLPVGEAHAVIETSFAPPPHPTCPGPVSQPTEGSEQ